MSDGQSKGGHGTAMHIAASRRSDIARPRNRGVRNRKGSHGVWGELNPLAPHAPWGLMQRLSLLHERGGAGIPPHSWTRGTASIERTRDRAAFKIRITFIQLISRAKQGEP